MEGKYSQHNGMDALVLTIYIAICQKKIYTLQNIEKSTFFFLFTLKKQKYESLHES